MGFVWRPEEWQRRDQVHANDMIEMRQLELMLEKFNKKYQFITGFKQKKKKNRRKVLAI